MLLCAWHVPYPGHAPGLLDALPRQRSKQNRVTCCAPCVPRHTQPDLQIHVSMCKDRDQTNGIGDPFSSPESLLPQKATHPWALIGACIGFSVLDKRGLSKKKGEMAHNQDLVLNVWEESTQDHIFGFYSLPPFQLFRLRSDGCQDSIDLGPGCAAAERDCQIQCVLVASGR